jgi:hypothetical protein
MHTYAYNLGVLHVRPEIRDVQLQCLNYKFNVNNHKVSAKT